MRILGIDPGLKATGYGFIEADQHDLKLLETGTIVTKQKDFIQDRLEKVHASLDQLIKQYHPNVLVLEKLYAHHRHPTTASILGHVRGVICLLCAQNNVPLSEYSVKRIRKSVTGNGNVTKEQTQQMIIKLLNIKEEKLTLDASDALALAIGHAYMHRYEVSLRV